MDTTMRLPVSWRGLGFLCLLLNALCSSFAVAHDSDGTIHIIHLSTNPNKDGQEEPEMTHKAYLKAALGNSSDEVDSCLIYCYKNVFNGFAAKLTSEQVNTMTSLDGVISVIPNSFGKVQTTNSWRFLGVESRSDPLTGALWQKANFGEDVIIGIIDTGIWPESPSFRDDGIGPIPGRWKGECIDADLFTKDLCNRKLIGAKFFHDANPGVTNDTFLYDYNSARDIDGHGTHVSSIAAGNFVAGANSNGYANGTAKGGAPYARIATYKVCWTNAACSFADIVAAIDEAIADGVDVISISIGGTPQGTPFYLDMVSIASFNAMKHGILISFAAGNEGPYTETVNHVEPWVVTVAAGSQDRFLGADVHVGLAGERLPALKLRGSSRTNYSTISAPLAVLPEASRYCYNGTLDSTDVEGKIVFCLQGDISELWYDKAYVVEAAGGVGIIVGVTAEAFDYQLKTAPDFYGFPGVIVAAPDASLIESFISAGFGQYSAGAIQPVATIFGGRTLKGIRPSPTVGDFSGRGPNPVTPDILKPDIMAPGVDILAAFADNRVPYMIMYGTSMAAPHIGGIAALLKAIHPKWSPAAIKSAIMTSARIHDNTNRAIRDFDGSTATPFAVGSGFVNPVAAADPGLVYDASPRDYSLFLCALGYGDMNVEVISGAKNFCSKEKYYPAAANLNYPSLSVANLTDETTVITRRVANVGIPRSVYVVSYQAPPGVKMTISPTILRFTALYQTKTFKVKFQRTEPADYSKQTYIFGSYTWSSGRYHVKSPIVLGTQPYNTTQ
ncbi:hypothetical protein R1sor_012886 [Riccia sorocarpa]|uniref:Uncharacterized protein n=1 Tax=Riccia sorocarpa TaxID=122646 RepID=A0ABD3I8T0_9MARC